MEKICLVACAASKKKNKYPAEDFYISPLFNNAKTFAKQHFDRWYILSAKYFLVDPRDPLEPYDRTLKKMSVENRNRWADIVFHQLVQKTNANDEITILAGKQYRERLEILLKTRGNKVLTPLKGKSIGKQLQWLTRINKDNKYLHHLERFYDLLDVLRKELGGGRILRECSGKLSWPRRGVYFLFEPEEKRKIDSLIPRVVRVGTHMVSKGSKATLWNRLRTHRGHKNGTGNHRASIFRRHIGEALINKSRSSINIPTWGQGQFASKSVRRNEESLERIVSNFIGSMCVLWLDVPDPAGPDSDRAFIERNAISLLSNAGRIIDPPSESWLGNYSSSKYISNSGLWNVNYVDYLYDNRFIEIFKLFVNITIGTSPRPDKRLAPQDWYLADKGKLGRGQLFLFKEEQE